MSSNVALARRSGGLAFVPKVTRAEVQRLSARALSARKSAGKLKEKSEQVVGEMVATTEVGLSAFACALLNGRYKADGGLKIANVPVDMAGALGFHLAGFLFVGNDAAAHMHNFGDGCLAGYLTRQGVKQGLRLSGKLSSGSSGSVAAIPPSSQGESVFSGVSGYPYADDDASVAGDDDTSHD